MYAMYLNTSNIKQKNVYWHIPFNVHIADKVTMSVDEWFPHYLIQSRSHSNSKGEIEESSNLKF